jgi:acyl-CoA thioester hydrolase
MSAPHRPMHAVEFRVRYPETDQMAVVYHANYLHWCDIGRTEYLRARGATYADLERNGMLLAVSEASLRYHASARYDQLVRIETTLREVRSRALTFDYVILDAETRTKFVTAHTVLVSLDAAGRPVQLPAETLELLRRDLPGA